tara:strand:- start:3159 stop:4181 length:1023 start_codon:yes stop_codon:yes gene_type:complete
MLNKKIIQDFNNIFPKYISDEFLFSSEDYMLFLDKLTIDPLLFFNKWSDINRQSIVDKYWRSNTKLDWKWSLSFPLFSLLEKYEDHIKNPTVIGFSGLPGSGKSTLGLWMDNVARELGLEIKVISLDDFYLPGKEMDHAMQGNPWDVPRGFPGSHSLDLLNDSLETFLKTGVLKCPTFDKSLRDGKGDRSGWCELKSKVLILEGWFVGCEPLSDHFELDNICEDILDLPLTSIEREYRFSIQESLDDYSKIWKKLDKIWHLKSSNFNNIITWKTQQEDEMIKLKGTGLKGHNLTNFIRMIQTSIPQKSLTSLNSDTIIEIDINRRIDNIYTNSYNFISFN